MASKPDLEDSLLTGAAILVALVIIFHVGHAVVAHPHETGEDYQHYPKPVESLVVGLLIVVGFPVGVFLLGRSWYAAIGLKDRIEQNYKQW